jgi:hypothetical protein
MLPEEESEEEGEDDNDIEEEEEESESDHNLRNTRITRSNSRTNAHIETPKVTRTNSRVVQTEPNKRVTRSAGMNEILEEIDETSNSNNERRYPVRNRSQRVNNRKKNSRYRLRSHNRA